MKATEIEVKHYDLKNIRPYLKKMIHDFQEPDTQKIQLTLAINFVSSKDNDEEQVMHSKSDNIKIMSR